MPLRTARRVAQITQSGWVAIRDRRRGSRTRWCSDTRGAQYFLALSGLAVALALLLAWLGYVEPHGAVEVLMARRWGAYPIVAGMVISAVHLAALRYDRGCNWLCWLCCLAQSAFWAWVFLFLTFLGFFGFTLIFLATAALGQWCAWCLLRPLETYSCDAREGMERNGRE